MRVALSMLLLAVAPSFADTTDVPARSNRLSVAIGALSGLSLCFSHTFTRAQPRLSVGYYPDFYGQFGKRHHLYATGGLNVLLKSWRRIGLYTMSNIGYEYRLSTEVASDNWHYIRFQLGSGFSWLLSNRVQMHFEAGQCGIANFDHARRDAMDFRFSPITGQLGIGLLL